MPGRKFTSSASKYKYGFNGKENDDETGTQDYGLRIYNPALARFLSVDPLSKEYPWNSTYAFAENTPIAFIDLDGAERQKAADGSIIDGPFDINLINKKLEENKNKSASTANSNPQKPNADPTNQFVTYTHDIFNWLGDNADAGEAALKTSVKVAKTSQSGKLTAQSSKNANLQNKDALYKQGDKVG